MRKDNPDKEMIPDLRRWPNLYSNAEEAADLLNHPGWILLLRDLQESRGRVDSLKHMVLYDLPADEIAERKQMFFRGKIAAYEDVINLAKDLKEWKERK